MSGLPLAFGRSTRRMARTVRLENENLFAEPSPANQEKGLILIGRPGLIDFASLATGPVRAYFCEPGVFEGDQFFPAGDTLYRVASNGVVTSAIGTMSGLERVSIAGGLGADAESEIRIVNGDACYLYDGTNIAAEATPDSVGFTAIEYLRGCWFAVREDTQEIYFRFISDTSWAALAFQSSEYKPDKAIALKRLGDQLVVFGESSVEFFSFSGDTTYPLVPYGAGLANEIGCAARDSVVRVRDSIYFVGDDSRVIRLSPQPQVISDPGLTEIIKGAAANTLVAWGFSMDNHEFYVLASEAGSYVYDTLTGFWSKWSTYGESYFRPWFGGNVGSRIFCADGVGTGDIWEMDPDAMDDDGEPIIVRFCAYRQLSEGRQEISSIELDCATGWGPIYSDRIEATNLYTYSQDFDNAAWTKTSASLVVTANAAVAPDGTTTADKIDDQDAPTLSDQLSRSYAVANDAVPRTFSIYLKQGNTTLTRVDTALTGGTAITSSYDITWATGTMTLASGVGGGTLTAVGSGWYRIAVTLTNNSSGNVAFSMGVRPAGVTTNAGYCYAWGAQLETGTSATEYIATTSAAASRYALLDPIIKARAYKDGVTPGAWRDAYMGSTGEYGKTVRWNRWGQFKPPGVLFEFECSEPVPRRFSGVAANVL